MSSVLDQFAMQGRTGAVPAMPTVPQPQTQGPSVMNLLLGGPSPQDRFMQLTSLNGAADKVADVRGAKTGPQTITGNQAIDFASTQLGSPYIWADMNPKGQKGGPGTGFDCSGLTKWVYQKMGISLPHSAAQQRDMAQSVGRNQLQPGDLVFFNYGRLGPNDADHVGIYMGNGQMIAASSGAGEVVTQPVDWAHFFGGGRF